MPRRRKPDPATVPRLLCWACGVAEVPKRRAVCCCDDCRQVPEYWRWAGRYAAAFARWKKGEGPRPYLGPRPFRQLWIPWASLRYPSAWGREQ